MLLGDDKKGNRGLENPGEEERRWELLGGLPFGTIDFILKNKKKKLLISREREGEGEREKTSWRQLPPSHRRQKDHFYRAHLSAPLHP